MSWARACKKRSGRATKCASSCLCVCSSSGTLLWKIEQKTNKAFACGKVTIKGKRHWYEALPQAAFVSLSDDTAWIIRTNGDLYLQTGTQLHGCSFPRPLYGCVCFSPNCFSGSVGIPWQKCIGASPAKAGNGKCCWVATGLWWPVGFGRQEVDRGGLLLPASAQQPGTRLVVSIQVPSRDLFWDLINWFSLGYPSQGSLRGVSWNAHLPPPIPIFYLSST